MALAEHPQFAVCPGCVAVPERSSIEGDITLSLPEIHCAACISGVESTLERLEGVEAARVNLTRKQVTIKTNGLLKVSSLIDVLHEAGYKARELDSSALGASADPVGRGYLTRLAVAGFAMMNVMVLSVSVWSGATSATRDFLHWVSAAITLPALAYAAFPFFASAIIALKNRRLVMDVPIALAIFLAAALSIFETSRGGQEVYFDAALSLTFFLLIGRYLDHKTRDIARSAAAGLTALEVDYVTLQDGHEIRLRDLEIGQIIQLKPGQRLPVDGVVLSGESRIDTAMLTGETRDDGVKAGAAILAGSVNLSSPLEVQVTATGKNTTLQKMAALVEIAENGRTLYNSLADRAARLYAPLVHLLALATFIGWMVFEGDAYHALNVAIAVLIITCPCALGLAVPSVNTAANGRLFNSGVLVKTSTALERLAQVTHVIFDKTGTLTTGKPSLINHDQISDEALSYAAALAESSLHPLSKAVFDLARSRGLKIKAAQNVKEIHGCGLEGEIDGKTYRFGRADWLGYEQKRQGVTESVLQLPSGEQVWFMFQDTLRSDAHLAIQKLRARGFKVILLSGDEAQLVQAIAHELDIDHAEGEMRPEEKSTYIKKLQAEGAKVLMVGDGLNDTIALAQADVSISPASALEAARVAADMVLLNERLVLIDEIILVAKASTRRIKENFAIAAIYNSIAIPFAVIGLATPLIAALAMSSSSLLVSLNALRLRR